MTSEELTVDIDGEEDGWQPDVPGLPRPAAVENLTNALRSRDLSPGAVRAFARAAVRPDEMRRKLADPTELRVQGGTLLVVETRLWTLAVTPHPANPREYGDRLYPLGRKDGEKRPLSFEPASNADGLAELQLRVSAAQELEDRVTAAKTRLVRSNPLAPDIAAEGILQPLTVVAMTAIQDDETQPTTFLIAADGSSRISAAFSILEGKPEDQSSVYALANDDRMFRRQIGSLLKLYQKHSWEKLTTKEQAQLRVLTLPARVVIGFRSDDRSDLKFHTAVRNLIGLTHIRPPKPYGSAVENEAKADAVLDILSTPQKTRAARISSIEKDWYGGTITNAQLAKTKLSPLPEIRAAEIVRSILGGGQGTTRRVNDGIRSLTAKLKPKREDRVDIAVELILRPLRENTTENTAYLKSRRAVLQRAYRLPEIEQLDPDELLENSQKLSQESLISLRDAALEELAAGHGPSGRLAEAQTELAVKAAYYMATAEPMALQREVFGGTGDEDDRGPASVLRAMLSRTRGVHQAYHIVRAGRADEELPEVDDEGNPIVVDGEVRVLSDEEVRNTYSGAPKRTAERGIVAARQQWLVISTAIRDLRDAANEMEEVRSIDGGGSFILQEGWDSLRIDKARKFLDVQDRRLARWGEIFDERSKDPNEDDHGDL